jgi:hypothetical protein
MDNYLPNEQPSKKTFSEWVIHIFKKDSKTAWALVLLVGSLLGWSLPDEVALPSLPTIRVEVTNTEDLRCKCLDNIPDPPPPSAPPGGEWIPDVEDRPRVEVKIP